MGRVIQFPNVAVTHKRPLEKTIPVVRVFELEEIKDCIDDLNDTLKYITDGLYSISLEIRETKEHLQKLL